MIAICLGAILISCAPNVTVAPQANNFAFVFKHTPCGSTPVDVLDTANGTLVHTPLGEPDGITIFLQLSDEELESVYQKAVSIDFFNYPSDFVVPDDQLIGYEVPVSSYELTMINGEMSNSVKWSGGALTKPDYMKATNLRDLVILINGIILSHPEYQQLPTPKAECA